MTRYVQTCVAAILLATVASAAENGLQSRNACGGSITQPTTITVSHAQSDPDTINCVWTIQATAASIWNFQAIKVMVQTNNVNLNTDCNDNFIKFYDGLVVDNEKLLATVCGNRNSRLIIPATENLMTVQFSSHRKGNDFSAKVYFTDSETVGCGGEIHLRDNLPLTLRPPQMLINGREVINCIWNIWCSENSTITMNFLNFMLPECTNTRYNLDTYHQRHETSYIGKWPTTCDSTCECNFLDVWDGVVPDSYTMGSYCGQCSPPSVVTSANKISLWMSAVPSMGFGVRFTVTPATCLPTVVPVTNEPTRLQSPGYPTLARGINCLYEFQADSHPVRLAIKNLDIQPGTTPGVCDKDKVVIDKRSKANSLGKDYVVRNDVLENEHQTKKYEFCGSHEVIELTIEGSFFLNLITAPEDATHKGLEIEVVRA